MNFHLPAIWGLQRGYHAHELFQKRLQGGLFPCALGRGCSQDGIWHRGTKVLTHTVPTKSEKSRRHCEALMLQSALMCSVSILSQGFLLSLCFSTLVARNHPSGSKKVPPLTVVGVLSWRIATSNFTMVFVGDVSVFMGYIG